MKPLFRSRTRRRSTTFRAGLEPLEGRALLSVSVTPFMDNAGNAVLRVIEAGRNDAVTITDNSTAGTTTVVADGKTQTFDHQFTLFDLELKGKADALEFDLAGAYSGRNANLQVNLGTGGNHFTFNPGLTAITNQSDVNLNVAGQNGKDSVDLNFGNILESRVNVATSNLVGNDVFTFGKSSTDSAGITTRNGIRNSSVDVNVGLGHGNNNFVFNYGSDLGHLAGAGVPGDFDSQLASTFNVNINGSDRRQDVDNVTLSANGEVNTGATLNFNTNLGAGNNSFKGVFDANLLQIDDDAAEISDMGRGQAGGVFNLDVQRGSGNDTVDVHSINQDAHTIELSGRFGINIHGGTGKDNTTTVDFGGRGFSDDNPNEVALSTNRDFRLRIDGGSGNNTIMTNLSNAAMGTPTPDVVPGSTFNNDIAIVGGSGSNNITFKGVIGSGGNPTFGPSGSVLIDGGSPSNVNNNHVTILSGNNFPVHVVNA